MPRLKPPIKAAIVGYGMGATHASLMQQSKDLEVVAVCDVDERHPKAARQKLSNVKTYADVNQAGISNIGNRSTSGAVESG